LEKIDVKMPALILLVVILMSFMGSLSFAGHGPYAQEQPGLLEVCRSWKTGDAIPAYLLDPTQYNSLSPNTPEYYIGQLDNQDLLLSLALTDDAPPYRSETALVRLLDVADLSGFKSLLDQWERRSRFLSNAKLEEIREFFSGKCLKFQYFYILQDDIPKDDAKRILEQIQAEISSGKDMMEVFNEYVFQKNISVVNGGSFNLSETTKQVFPSSRSYYAPKFDLSRFFDLNKGDSFITEESSTPLDRDLTRQGISAPSKDSVDLCILTDVLGSDRKSSVTEPDRGRDISGEFDAKVWRGTYQLSSGHDGELVVGPNRTFVFILPDEDHETRYTGSVQAFMLEQGVELRGVISEGKRTYYKEEGQSRGVDENYTYDPSFEMVLKGEWLKATPGPQEIMEGRVSFTGEGSGHAGWFPDKTGTFMIHTGDTAP
jgi:hypothetical protein